MIEVLFSESMFQRAAIDLLGTQLESCAIVLAARVAENGRDRLLAREVWLATPDAYRKRNTTAAILEPAFLAQVAKRAIQSNHALIFLHTHPFDPQRPRFSAADDAGERELAAFLTRRGQSGPHIAVVISPGGTNARLLGTSQACKVTVIGTKRRVLTPPEHLRGAEEQFDRNVRLLGRQGQAALEGIAVAIVGLGGTGSVVAQQLGYLGVGRCTLVDFDHVTEDNLNRLVGASPLDIGRPKVQVVAEQLARYAPRTEVKPVRGDVTSMQVAMDLRFQDFIFVCTDTHGSRAILNQLAYQYGIPSVNLGVSISVVKGQVEALTGRVQLLSPEIPCLTCQDALDSNQVRYDLMTAEARAQDPYFLGPGDPQPAVVSLNSSVSSMAVTVFLQCVTELPGRNHNFVYNAIEGWWRPVKAAQDPACVVCSWRGALLRGDEWALPARVV